jgi:hypothetical protein
MGDEPDYILDLSSQAAGQGSVEETGIPSAEATEPEASAGPDGTTPASPRKWIGVHFQCCDVYSRIWRNREGSAYVGYCPRCNRKIQAKIGPGGVDARFFKAG